MFRTRGIRPPYADAERAEADSRAQLWSMTVRLRTDMTEIQVTEAIGVPKQMEVGTCTVDRPDGRTGPSMCKIYTGTVGFGTDDGLTSSAIRTGPGTYCFGGTMSPKIASNQPPPTQRL
jgi:hypothetical protein